jgi:hypothetical protein
MCKMVVLWDVISFCLSVYFISETTQEVSLKFVNEWILLEVIMQFSF